jgi:hypothetical protein
MSIKIKGINRVGIHAIDDEVCQFGLASQIQLLACTSTYYYRNQQRHIREEHTHIT